VGMDTHGSWRVGDDRRVCWGRKVTGRGSADATEQIGKAMNSGASLTGDWNDGQV
jgi:hypothetical protein